MPAAVTELFKVETWDVRFHRTRHDLKCNLLILYWKLWLEANNVDNKCKLLIFLYSSDRF